MRLGIRRRDVEVVPEGARKCKNCGAVKRLDAFRLVRSYVQPGGYRRWTCKACEKADRQDWYHHRGGKELRRENERGKKQKSKRSPSPMTPLQRLLRSRSEAKHRMKKLNERIAEIDREIARMKGDVV